tara:strand:- start:1777 stop:2205 length:429 start_codon:yes stop_codon:yes gene_type:complete
VLEFFKDVPDLSENDTPPELLAVAIPVVGIVVEMLQMARLVVAKDSIVRRRTITFLDHLCKMIDDNLPLISASDRQVAFIKTIFAKVSISSADCRDLFVPRCQMDLPPQDGLATGFSILIVVRSWSAISLHLAATVSADTTS